MCKDIVMDCWESNGNASYYNKLQACQAKLQVRGKEITGNFAQRIRDCKHILKHLKHRRDCDSIRLYAEEQNKLNEILTQKEIFWRQRSKQFWLQHGDQNSKFFHSSASAQRRNNQIKRLQNNNGEWLDWSNGLDQLIFDYFSQIFAASNSQWNEVLNKVQTSITEQLNLDLLKPIQDEEVKFALFQMNPDKAPGPDGMTPGFFQKYWSIVGADLIKIVRDFFDTGQLTNDLNETNIVLIPKKKVPTSMGDLRPIALCNVSYKLISKVLANRMKPLLDMVISPNQSAFIPGRLITDNIMVSFEVLHYLKRKRVGKEGYMAVKLDMSKAYDRVEWSFIEAIMGKMGFDVRWTRLLSQCFSTVLYKVIHGGKEMGPIVPTRGIRQGDPISPYLFIICHEGFTSLINDYIHKGWIHGCRVANGAPSISHMLFADDSYLYCKATINEAVKVCQLLQTFEAASGQQVNRQKSSIFFSTNTDEVIRDEVCSQLRMTEATDQSTYLGLPNTMGRNKNVVLGFLKDRVRKRIESWNGQIVSKAGKEILLKTVVQALPTYTMSVFLLPVQMCKEIEQLMCNFWWESDTRTKKGIHWSRWDNLCKPKSIGGLGFRKLHDFNLALLGKQAWRLLNNEESLVTKIFKARYFSKCSFLDAELGSNPSFIWRSIWATQNLIRNGSRWRIGSGGKIQVIEDAWLQDSENPFVTSRHPALQNQVVNGLMKMGIKEWDTDVITDLFNERDQALILGIPLSSRQEDDIRYWHKEGNGRYSVKSAFRLIQELKGAWVSNANSGFWRSLWNLKSLLKSRTFCGELAVGTYRQKLL